MRDMTVLYYTANTENESFEQKIRANTLKYIGDLPLISVSQVPIDFGENICVGRHVPCYPNEFRQIQLGLQRVKTRWVLVAEADCLYPPSYFNYTPEGDAICYRYNPVYVYFLRHKPVFRHKGYSDGSQIMDRDWWLRAIDEQMQGRPDWSTLDDPPLGMFTPRTDLNHIWTGDPVVTFKTGHGVSNKTFTSKRIEPVEELPFWGSARQLRKDME